MNWMIVPGHSILHNVKGNFILQLVETDFLSFLASQL